MSSPTHERDHQRPSLAPATWRPTRSPAQFFNGTLDDVRLYSRAETALEVMADMNRPLSAGPADSTAPSVSVTSPAEGDVVTGARTLQADASDDVGVAGRPVLCRRQPAGAGGHGRPLCGQLGHPRHAERRACACRSRPRHRQQDHGVDSRERDRREYATPSRTRSSPPGFDLPTAMKFLPDGRLLLDGAGGQDPGPAAALYDPESDPVPADHQHPLQGVQAGIFDLALDPNFAANHYFYVFYTTATPGSDRLSRFTANSALTGTVPGSELVLYQDPQAADIEHHGGAITFGNDGMIYFTTGDHFQGTPSQDLNSPRGKIHRIWPDGLVPTDNPFYDGSGPALGLGVGLRTAQSVSCLLRPPHRPALRRRRRRQRQSIVRGGGPRRPRRELRLAGRRRALLSAVHHPLYSYIHNGNGSSITGGFVYHGTQFPSGMQGNYFFADYSGRWIKRMAFDSNGNVNGVFNFEPLTGNNSAGDIVYLTEGPDGALYYLDLGYADTTGTFGISKLRRIRYLASNQAPVALASADKTSGPAPLAVQLLERGLERSRGPAHHLLVGLRRRQPVDGREPIPHVREPRPVRGSGHGLRRGEQLHLDSGDDQRGQPADRDDHGPDRWRELPCRGRHQLQR